MAGGDRPILRHSCLILPSGGGSEPSVAAGGYHAPVQRNAPNPTSGRAGGRAGSGATRGHRRPIEPLRAALAASIAARTTGDEDRPTGIPGLALFRREG